MSITDRSIGRRLVALVAAIAFVSAACGDDDGGTAEAGGATTAASTTSDQADPDGVVRVGYDLVQVGGRGVTFDPGMTRNNTNDALTYMIHGRLMRPTADGKMVPDLAESATLVDANTIDVVIREGVTFSDGAPFDAQAVKVGLERTLASDNEGGLTTPFLSLKSVEVTGPNSVRLSIPDGTAASWYDSFLGAWQTTIVRPDTDFNHPVGAGPMRVVEYQPEQSLILERNESYWDAGSLKLARMEFMHSSADQAQSGIAALRADQVDFVLTDPTQLAGLSGNIDVLSRTDEAGLVSMQLCKRDGPLADARVRTAVNKAIDREAVSEAAYLGTAQPASQLFPEGHRFYNGQVADTLAFDPDAARALLEEAGYADGVSFDLYVLPSLGLPDAAEVMQQQLADVGITVNIILADNYVEDFLTPQNAGAGLIPGGSTGRQKLAQWVGEGTGNTCQYDDPELTGLVGQLAAVGDSSDDAVELWNQISAKVVGDALGVFVVFRSNLAAYDTERFADLQVWSIGNQMVPDPFTTTVNAGS